MVMVGRITKHATVHQLNDGREVVHFTVALNDWYKPKRIEDPVKITTYVNCSYWLNVKIAPRLTKGKLVEVYGRIQVNAYIGTDNEAKATINCHVNNIIIHGAGKEVDESSTGEPQESSNQKVEQNGTDDLPF